MESDYLKDLEAQGELLSLNIYVKSWIFILITSIICTSIVLH